MSAPSGPAVGVVDLADSCGRLQWVADALFVLEGRWSAEMDRPESVEHLATQSRLHGWHASLWNDLLPDSPALQASTRIVPPSQWEAAISLAGELGDDAADSVKLALLYRALLPRAMALVYELGARTVGPGNDAAARIVEFVRADQHRDLEGGQALLATALGDEHSIANAASAVQALDRAFASL